VSILYNLSNSGAKITQFGVSGKAICPKELMRSNCYSYSTKSKNYAVTTHRYFVLKHLEPWILHAETNPDLNKDDIDAEDKSIGEL
jgi:hypothetical protein